MTTIYLAGPMEGVTKAHMTGWREQAKKRIDERFYHRKSTKPLSLPTVLDPTRRMPFHKEAGMNYARLVFQADLRDIDRSTCLLVDARRSSGKAAGTNMEIMYAWTLGKPIFLWVDPGDPDHPFYMSMATTISPALESSVDLMCDFLMY